VNHASPSAPFPFVVGCDRSGTTLVRALLDSHPEMAIPSESYFPAALLRRRRDFERAGTVDVDALLAFLRPLARWQRWGVSEDRVRTVLHAGVRTVPDAIRGLYRAYAQQAGKSRFGDKTPKFVFDIELLGDAFPEAVFVHVVRDGRDIALSRQDAGWRLRNIGAEALRWRTHVVRGREQGRRLAPHRYLELRYEDLVSDPERGARALCDFTALEFDEAMLRYPERAGELVRTAEHPGLHANISRPPTPGLRSWDDAMSDADIRAYDAAAGDTLRSFGYVTGTRGLGPSDRLRATAVRARWRIVRGDARVSGAARRA
jgi:hypothetical protein